MVYIAKFFEHYKGSDGEAARALFKSMREEKGIILKRESIPKIFGAKKGFIVPAHLEHQEHILDHLHDSGIADYSFLRKFPRIYGKHVDSRKTLKNLGKLDPSYCQKSAYEQADSYLTHLDNHSFHLEWSQLDEILHPEQVHQMTLAENADLAIDFNLLVAVCPPGWTNKHLDRSRFRFNGEWRDDFNRTVENYFEEKGYFRLTHGMCDECGANHESRMIKKD